jgi:hypothetical protein
MDGVEALIVISGEEDDVQGERGVFHAPIITHSRRIARGKKKKM